MPNSAQPPLSEYSVKIKHVLIEMKSYNFYHSPFSKNVDYRDKDAEGPIYDDRFLGRNRARRTIVNILENSATKSGTYLIAGYRGMGKTSVVRMAVAEYNHKKRSQNSKDGQDTQTESTNNKDGQDPQTKSTNNKDGQGENKPRSQSIRFKKALNVLLTIVPPLIIFLLGYLILLPSYPPSISLFSDFLDSIGLIIGQDGTWLQNVLKNENFLIRVIFFLITAYLFLVIFYGTIDSVREIRKENHEKEKIYETIEISLSEDKISEEAILKRLTIGLLTYWRKYRKQDSSAFQLKPIYKPIRFIWLLLQAKNDDPTPKKIEESLSILSKRIVSKVSMTNPGANGATLSFGGSDTLGKIGLPFQFGSGKNSFTYDVATPKEIEDELIGILNDIDFLREEGSGKNIPSFVFVIDELDKIEIPGLKYDTSEETNEYDPIYTPDSTLTRRRQQALAALLGNLKNFLNVARAKFFFIGGRELYDASLADIADRDSFYSSIFNQTIYIKSFFKDKASSRAGITQMTENYLCRLILDDLKRKDLNFTENQAEKYNLKSLAEYLHVKENIGFFDFPNKASDEKISLYERMMKYKVLFLLQNYIIYLTYRSNGTPKKLASLIEYITVPGWSIKQENPPSNQKESEGKQEIIDRENLIIYNSDSKKINPNSQYLRFKFDFQYEVAFTAELYRPYLIMKSRHIKALGDKLLFSNAFIFDHILKFHPFGFSWRHLEMIPEIILVNREPNLRAYMQELLAFLLKNNIKETTTGLFEYRFYNKVKTELTFISKISDLSSAAFNFTLDESLQIKKHYRNRLLSLQTKYKEYTPVNGDNKFVYSIYFIQLILGDLHYYDQEYDEAIIYYTESIQTLKLASQEPKRINSDQYLLWVKSKLKCALALEKIRDYDLALIYYSDLTNSIQSQLGKKSTIESSLLYGESKNMRLFVLPILGTLSTIEKSRRDGITYSNILKAEKWMCDILFKSEKVSSALLNKTSTEKEDKDFLRYSVIYADFHSNLGSILFYKNCQYREYFESENLFSKQIVKKVSALRWAKKEFHKDAQPSVSAFIHYLNSICYLNCHYVDSFEEKFLKFVKEKLDGENQKKYPLTVAAMYLYPEYSDFINANKLYFYANILTKLADSVLSGILYSDQNQTNDNEESGKKIKFSVNQFQKIDTSKKTSGSTNEIESKRRVSIEGVIEEFKKIESKSGDKYFSLDTVFIIYRLSAQFYLRAGKQRSAGFQYRKMLFITKEVILDSFNDKDHQRFDIAYKPKKGETKSKEDIIKETCQSLAVRVFKYASRSLDIAGRPQILKYRDILDVHKNDFRPLIYQNINISSDVRESILLTEQIKIYLNATSFNKPDPVEGLKYFFQDRFVSPYGIVSNRYVRLFELEATADSFYYIFKKAFENSSKNIESEITIFKNWINEKNADAYLENFKKKLFETHEVRIDQDDEESLNKDILIFGISESIFAMHEIIRSIQIYGVDNFVSYSYLARAHAKLGTWCQVFRNIKWLPTKFEESEELSEVSKACLKQVEQMVGSHSLPYLEANYHYEQAIQYYYKAISIHNEGEAYKKNVTQLYFLEDDYNDNLRHFVTALERFRCNTMIIRDSIRELSKKIENSKLYNYDSYYPIK